MNVPPPAMTDPAVLTVLSLQVAKFPMLLRGPLVIRSANVCGAGVNQYADIDPFKAPNPP